MELHLENADIETAKRRADRNDVKLQAVEIFMFWRQRNGKRASRLALIEALYNCDLVEAKEILEDEWHFQFPGNITITAFQYYIFVLKRHTIILQAIMIVKIVFLSDIYHTVEFQNAPRCDMISCYVY